jgi:galactose mutarotase-like enzyme
MFCGSLRHEGEELLGGVEVPGVPPHRWTEGIALLHPWANRLGDFGYGDVTLARDDLYLEEHGLPLHGLRSAVTGWELLEHRLDFAAAGRELVGVEDFPFDHRIEVAADLVGNTLTITTTLTAIGERPVPIAFGYHPYFVLAGVPRAEWEVALAVKEHVAVDERLIPTGVLEPVGDLDGPLGARTFDDGYTFAGGLFAVSGGGRRIEVDFERGYPYAQVFAPAIADVVCFEPMTAPANALRGSPGVVAPGESYEAQFSVRVWRAA